MAPLGGRLHTLVMGDFMEQGDFYELIILTSLIAIELSRHFTTDELAILSALCEILGDQLALLTLVQVPEDFP